MASYKTSDFRKGLKVQIDGEPYLMIEMNFVKPGKGNAMYKCKLRNLIRNTVLDRTYKGGESLEAADVEETEVQFLYRQADTFVFMDSETFDQFELSAEQVDDNWKYLKEGMVCSTVLYNGNPITMTPPNHVELKVEYCEPAVKGNTATNVTKAVKMETGAEFQDFTRFAGANFLVQCQIVGHGCAGDVREFGVLGNGVGEIWPLHQDPLRTPVSMCNKPFNPPCAHACENRKAGRIKWR